MRSRDTGASRWGDHEMDRDGAGFPATVAGDVGESYFKVYDFGFCCFRLTL